MKIAIDNLLELKKNHMNGLYTDIKAWDFNLSIIKSECVKNPDNEFIISFTDEIDELFKNYLLLNHPNNSKLKIYD